VAVLPLVDELRDERDAWQAQELARALPPTVAGAELASATMPQRRMGRNLDRGLGSAYDGA